MNIGIRETRQKLTQLLKRVHNGETLVITDRKRPVAKIIPVREGRIRLASHAKLRKTIVPKGQPLSRLVIQDREK